jgi:hypothetical protein
MEDDGKGIRVSGQLREAVLHETVPNNQRPHINNLKVRNAYAEVRVVAPQRQERP